MLFLLSSVLKFSGAEGLTEISSLAYFRTLRWETWRLDASTDSSSIFDNSLTISLTFDKVIRLFFAKSSFDSSIWRFFSNSFSSISTFLYFFFISLCSFFSFQLRLQSLKLDLRRKYTCVAIFALRKSINENPILCYACTSPMNLVKPSKWYSKTIVVTSLNISRCSTKLSSYMLKCRRKRREIIVKTSWTSICSHDLSLNMGMQIVRTKMYLLRRKNIGCKIHSIRFGCIPP